MSVTVDSLELEVQVPSTQAEKNLDRLAESLGKLKNATKNLGLNGVAKQVSTLNASLNTVSSDNAEKLNKLAQSLQTLSQCGKLKLSPSVATQIASIGNAAQTLNGMDFSALDALSSALQPLSNIGKANLNSFISQLTRLPQAVQALNSVNMGGLNSKLAELVSALSQLSNMGKNNLTSFVTQLNKIPKLMENLKNVDMRTLYNQIQSLVRVFTPLATQMERVSAGFAAFPSRIQRLIQTTDNLSASNNRTSKSYVNLAAKIGIAYAAVTRMARVMANMMSQAIQWDGIVQRFSRSFGEYAQNAYSWIKRLNEEMYINTQQFMQYSSIFASMLQGYGISQKDATTMAIGYTELAYDIWAGYNDIYASFDDAASAVRATIAGEVEQIRRAGFTIVDSQLALTAANHGVAYSTQSATEEMKSYLRYLTLVDQAKTQNLVGTFAREMTTAEGLIRTLKQQIISVAQAFGSVFLPILSKVLPYIQAFVQLIGEAIVAVASLFGIDIQPVDFSTNLGAVGDAAVGSGDLANNLGDAAKKSKEIKNALLGIDELNIISPPENTSGSGADGIGGVGGGGLFDIDKLWDENIFDSVNQQVAELKEKLKELVPIIAAIGASFATWKIAKGLVKALEWLSTMKGFNILGSVGFKITGLALFLDAWNTMKEAIQDIMQNGVNFTNATKLLGGFAEGIGAAFLLLGQVKYGGAALIISGVAGMISDISNMVKTGINWENATSFIKNLGLFLSGIGLVFSKDYKLAGIGLTISGISLILQNLKALLTGFTTGDFSNVNWIEVASGAVMLIGGLILVFKKIEAVEDTLNTTTVTEALTNVTTATETLDTTTSTLSPKLSSLAKNIGMGVLILGEVAAGAVIFAGAIAVVGWELGKVAEAWQPVIDNAGTVAIAIGVGTGILAGIGLAAYALGTAGATIALNIGIGIAILAELGVAAGLFIVEIWAIGKGLDEIGKAWQPVLDNGETIATGIGLGTALLVGIGVVTAALGAATIATGATLPVAIGLGSGMLVLLSEAVILFVNELAKVADNLSNNLSPKLEELNSKLPPLTSNMNSFVGFMEDFATATWQYTQSSAVAGLSATIDTIVDWFTQDPINKLTNEVEKIAGQAQSLNDNLEIANPELQTAIRLLHNYTNFIDELGNIAGSGGTVKLSEGLKVNLKEVGSNIVTGFNEGIKSKYSTIQSTIKAWGTDVQKWFTNSSYGGVNREKFATFAGDIINGFKNKISSSSGESKSGITTWATNVKNWFTNKSYGGVNRETFEKYAKDIIDGFKNGVVNGSESAKSGITTWANNTKRYFTDIVSYDAFYDIGKDVVRGFNNGVNDLYYTTRSYMREWAADAKAAFKAELDSNSPSKVFERIGFDTVLGYNNGIASLGKTTRSVVDSWAKSFTSVSPVMSFAVDTSALRYYSSDSFARTVSTEVTSNNRYKVDTPFSKEVLKEAMLEALNDSRIAENTKRQADKKEQTIVRIGNRTINDAVITQQQANGYRFVTT